MHYTPEMLEYFKETNEDMFHIFGYVKDDRNDNNTPFMDYEGKARLESVEKTNYYKKLNELAWVKRLRLKHGHLPKDKIRLCERDP